ncbi:hypothetical protein BB934_26155 [Microvirga ossetica]|uniref:Uncharacterized protein n=1 Tax=Microvirga ossetica TaxID=1882682 RepID=A0A1B2EMT5_9HYPH|nr:hypothetical protein [Microvirga ossetica]ANY81269.1 hypothetical protein BB934_26155 [Microvirga ossetica]
MLRDIQRVEKSGASRILLHKDKGKTEDLVRTITTLHLTVTDLALRSTASFDSKVRTHEGADLHGIIGATEYLRSDGSAPFFDVLSASTGAAATAPPHARTVSTPSRARTSGASRESAYASSPARPRGPSCIA